MLCSIVIVQYYCVGLCIFFLLSDCDNFSFQILNLKYGKLQLVKVYAIIPVQSMQYVHVAQGLDNTSAFAMLGMKVMEFIVNVSEKKKKVLLINFFSFFFFKI